MAARKVSKATKVRNLKRLMPKKPVVLIRLKKQTGRSYRKLDKSHKALPPGKRRSVKGKDYWETRANRSDLNRTLRL